MAEPTHHPSPGQPAGARGGHTVLSDEEYAQATSDRNIRARRKGLPGPYIKGGLDPDPEATAREERRLKRLLVGMVVLIVGGGFLVSIVGLILQGSGG